MTRYILTNARVVLPDRTVEGSVVVDDDRIVDIVAGRHFAEGIDLHGMWLAPGVIDIHTDQLEREILPRAHTGFPLPMAYHMLDQRALASGITTVLCAGHFATDSIDGAIELERLMKTALARHFLHVRWNTNFGPVKGVLARMQQSLTRLGNLVYNESIMGARQFTDPEVVVQRLAISAGSTLEAARAMLEEHNANARLVNNRADVLAAFGGRLPIGSHDDTTVEHVLEAHQMGATLAEMPTTLVAARTAKHLEMQVCMGAPNYYRGGSHCNNVSCEEAMAEGLVDILCSDYHFPSLLGSVLLMMERGLAPHDAMRYVSLNPARHLGKDHDLGSIEPGKLADLIAFESRPTHAQVHSVWVGGALRFQTAVLHGLVVSPHELVAG